MTTGLALFAGLAPTRCKGGAKRTGFARVLAERGAGLALERVLSGLPAKFLN